jgi:hypothetical protein
VRWRPRSRLERSAATVVTEAERLVDGSSFDEQVARHRVVPAWAVVGALAHADRSRLVALEEGRTPGPSRRWSAVLSYLAAEVARCATSDVELSRIQRQVLIPLELDLLDPRLRWVGSPAQLVEELRSDLKLAGWAGDA